jgi:molybdopterin-guanine dinucleotide biosynthesis protein A
MIEWNAIVLAGGRASRLGGIDKTALVFHGRTLLEHALASVSNAGQIVVVGGSSAVVESPRYAGPAAATIAGLDALARPRAPWTAVIAADQPLVAAALPLLLEAIEQAPFMGGVVAVDENGRRQPLLALYNTAALGLAGAEARSRGNLENLGMTALVAPILTLDLRVPAGLCTDVDTADDARALGIRVGSLTHV